MLKIKINSNRLTFAEGGIMFDAVVDNGKLIELSDIRAGDLKKPEDRYVTEASVVGQNALKTFEKAVVNNVNVKGWEIDGLPVEVCRSAAGYYAGCMDTDGSPYTRISGYSRNKAFVLHWMHSQVNNNDGDYDGNDNQNIQDAIDVNSLTVGQYANMASKLASVGEEKPDKVKALRDVNEAITQRLEKAAIKYRELAAKYNSLVAAYNEICAKLNNANKAN